jgi:hypothetical protein
VDEARDRVQRVEEKVRVQLALQRLELGLDEARLELRRVDRSGLGLAAIREGVADANDEEIRHHEPVELPQVVAEEELPPDGPGLVRHERNLGHGHRGGVRHGEPQCDRCVHQRLPLPGNTALPQPLGECHDARRQERRDIPIQHVRGQQMRQHRRHGLALTQPRQPERLEC